MPFKIMVTPELPVVVVYVYYMILYSDQNAKGKYECRFLFVELKGHPPATIVLEDNRHGLDSSG